MLVSLFCATNHSIVPPMGMPATKPFPAFRCQVHVYSLFPEDSSSKPKGKKAKLEAMVSKPIEKNEEARQSRTKNPHLLREPSS